MENIEEYAARLLFATHERCPICQASILVDEFTEHFKKCIEEDLERSAKWSREKRAELARTE